MKSTQNMTVTVAVGIVLVAVVVGLLWMVVFMVRNRRGNTSLFSHYSHAHGTTSISTNDHNLGQL